MVIYQWDQKKGLGEHRNRAECVNDFKVYAHFLKTKLSLNHLRKVLLQLSHDLNTDLRVFRPLTVL